MKKLILTAVAGILAFAASESYAAVTCTYYGVVERVTNYPGTGSSVIYIRTSSVSNAYYYAYTADAKILDAANAALTARTQVQIQGYNSGTPTTCPTSGYLGTVNYLVVSP